MTELRVVDAEIVQEGWFSDESGLPIFLAESVEAIDGELVDIRSREGANKLKLAAVLTEASEKRFYGEGTLQRVCKENQINYVTGRRLVAGYKRLARCQIDDRSSIVSAILSGELFWSKAEITAAVEDDAEYTKLMNESANGSLSNAKLRKRVKEITGEGGDSGEEKEEAYRSSAWGFFGKAEDASMSSQRMLFLDDALRHAERFDRHGGFKVLEFGEGDNEEYLLQEDQARIRALKAILQRWDRQIKNELSKRGAE